MDACIGLYRSILLFQFWNSFMHTMGYFVDLEYNCRNKTYFDVGMTNEEIRQEYNCRILDNYIPNRQNSPW